MVGNGGESDMCVVLAGCCLAQLDDIDDDLVCVHRVVEACGWMDVCVCVCVGGVCCRGILGLLLLFTELDDDVLA